jgi:hypothetical protein
MRRPDGRLGILAALSVPVELDGGVIGTLDIYAQAAPGLGPQRGRAPQAYTGLVASLLSAAVTAQVKAAWPTSCRPPWSIGG